MAGKMDAKIDYAQSCLDKGMSRAETVNKMVGKFGGSEGYYKTLVYILFRGSVYRQEKESKAEVKKAEPKKATPKKTAPEKQKKTTPTAKPKAKATPKRKAADAKAEVKVPQTKGEKKSPDKKPSGKVDTSQQWEF